MTKGDQTFLLWGGLALGVGAIILGWVNLQATGQIVSTPQGQTLDLPSGSVPAPATYVPATFTIPGLVTTGQSPASSPGSNVVMNFGGTDLITNYASNPYTGSQKYQGGCGCGSSDSATAACNSPGATTQAFGDPATAAAAIMSNIGPAITAAFSAGQQIRQEQNYDLMANNPSGSALFVPPAPSLSLGGLNFG